MNSRCVTQQIRIRACDSSSFTARIEVLFSPARPQTILTANESRPSQGAGFHTFDIEIPNYLTTERRRTSGEGLSFASPITEIICYGYRYTTPGNDLQTGGEGLNPYLSCHAAAVQLIYFRVTFILYLFMPERARKHAVCCAQARSPLGAQPNSNRPRRPTSRGRPSAGKTLKMLAFDATAQDGSRRSPRTAPYTQPVKPPPR